MTEIQVHTLLNFLPNMFKNMKKPVKITFSRRISEPKIMEEKELKVFEDLSKKNYKRWFIPFVDEALQTMKIKEGKILDVGCGPGLLAKEFAVRSRKLEVTGIDTSFYAIRLAQKNCEGLKNTRFQIGNAYKIPFPERTFDLVVCKDSFHHFDNIKRALQEMLRVLKDHGTLYAQDLRRDLPQYLLQRAIPPNTILKKLQFYSARAAYTKKEIQKVLKDLHINTYNVKTKKLSMHIVQAYEKRGLNPTQLKEGLQARYIAIVRK